jgi:hypothetical protein
LLIKFFPILCDELEGTLGENSVPLYVLLSHCEKRCGARGWASTSPVLVCLAIRSVGIASVHCRSSIGRGRSRDSWVERTICRASRRRSSLFLRSDCRLVLRISWPLS